MITFGMVTIPVKLYTASESSSSISFNLLDAKTKTRLKQKYVRKDENEQDVEVTRAEMVKGYEFTKGQYVTFTDEEIKAMQEESNRAIEITEFIPLAKIDPVFFDGAYYLGPEKGGEKAYKLLNAAMKETGRAALARWSARGKQHLVLIRPIEGGGLVMQQLLYKDEVKDFSEVGVPDAEVKDSELKLAVQLVGQIANDEFHPENYQDEVRKRMHEAIQRKIEGHEITATPEQPKAQIIDLMEALKASLAGKTAAAEAAKATAAEAAKARAEEPEQRATGTEGKKSKTALRGLSGGKGKR